MINNAWNFMDGFYNGSMMGGGMIFFWLIFLIIIIFVFKSFFSESRSSETALEVLKKRYANGEISHEQFEEMKQKLSS